MKFRSTKVNTKVNIDALSPCDKHLSPLFVGEIMSLIMSYFSIESLVNFYGTSKKMRKLFPLYKFIPKWDLYTRFVDFIHKKGHIGGIFGGAVRDHFANAPINDLDIIIYDMNNSIDVTYALNRLFPNKGFIRVNNIYDMFSIPIFRTSQFEICGEKLQIDALVVSKRLCSDENIKQDLRNYDFDVNGLVYIHPYAKKFFSVVNSCISRLQLHQYFSYEILLNGPTNIDMLNEIQRHLFLDNNIITSSYLIDCMAERMPIDHSSISMLNDIFKNISEKKAVLYKTSMYRDTANFRGKLIEFRRLKKLYSKNFAVFLEDNKTEFDLRLCIFKIRDMIKKTTSSYFTKIQEIQTITDNLVKWEDMTDIQEIYNNSSYHTNIIYKFRYKIIKGYNNQHKSFLHIITSSGNSINYHMKKLIKIKSEMKQLIKFEGEICKLVNDRKLSTRKNAPRIRKLAKLNWFNLI